MLVTFRKMWCLSEPNIDGFCLSSLILQIRFRKIQKMESHYLKTLTISFHFMV